MTASLSDEAPSKLQTPSPGGAADVEYTEHEFDAAAVSQFLETKQGKSCLRAEWRHDKSVSSAYWDPRGRAIVSTSYDDNLRCESF